MPKLPDKAIGTTIREFTGEDYKFFKEARHTFRVRRVDGIIDQEVIEAVSKRFDISLDEAGAILSGQIPTTDNPDKGVFKYDRSDSDSLFNPHSEEPASDSEPVTKE